MKDFSVILRTQRSIVNYLFVFLLLVLDIT